MASRHLARSIAMQTLYEWDFRKEDDANIEDILNRNLEEFGPGLEEKAFSRVLVSNVLKKNDEIDNIIENAAPEWPLNQIAVVDRNVLRIGLWELLFGDYKEVPPKVAINEAIELAKTFGGEKSGKFINGVLGTVYREIGEPGKSGKSKKELSEEDIAKLPVEKKAGGVVFRKSDKDCLFALVHDVFGYWTLSKGSVGEGEKTKDVAIRAVKEELGIKTAKVLDELGSNEYVAHDPETGPIRRRVTFYLIETNDKILSLGPSGGLTEAKWFMKKSLKDINTYPDIKEIFDKAIKKIK